MMRGDPILATLHAHAEDLRRRGIVHASVFGSVARGEDRPNSDVDIMVELEPDVGIFAFSEIRLHLSDLLGRRVDLVTPGGLQPFARRSALRDAIRVF
ncbi:MAG: polymerase beta domain protein region [Geminicoccaceae bacterium]|jgi:predicted nucleotidyltransferase|nr:polymerase beta domain protein region [Geminicoccaceae bacterium]